MKSRGGSLNRPVWGIRSARRVVLANRHNTEGRLAGRRLCCEASEPRRTEKMTGATGATGARSLKEINFDELALCVESAAAAFRCLLLISSVE